MWHFHSKGKREWPVLCRKIDAVFVRERLFDLAQLNGPVIWQVLRSCLRDRGCTGTMCGMSRGSRWDPAVALCVLWVGFCELQGKK